jgi:hypothetical protein
MWLDRHLLSSRVLTTAHGGHVGFIDTAIDHALRILAFIKARAVVERPSIHRSPPPCIPHPELRTLPFLNCESLMKLKPNLLVRIDLRFFHEYVLQGGWIAPRRCYYSRWMATPSKTISQHRMQKGANRTAMTVSKANC